VTVGRDACGEDADPLVRDREHNSLPPMRLFLHIRAIPRRHPLSAGERGSRTTYLRALSSNSFPSAQHVDELLVFDAGRDVMLFWSMSIFSERMRLLFATHSQIRNGSLICSCRLPARHNERSNRQHTLQPHLAACADFSQCCRRV